MIDQQQQQQQQQQQWRVTWYDGERIVWSRFEVAWAYAMPDAGNGWTYLPKASAIQRFAAGEQKIPVAWKNNRVIYLEWL
jgi:hypothetical protein